MTRKAHPSSQFEQFTIDQGAQITITRIDVFRMTVDARRFDVNSDAKLLMVF